MVSIDKFRNDLLDTHALVLSRSEHPHLVTVNFTPLPNTVTALKVNNSLTSYAFFQSYFIQATQDNVLCK